MFYAGATEPGYYLLDPGVTAGVHPMWFWCDGEGWTLILARGPGEMQVS